MSLKSAYRARYVFPVDGPPIPDGIVAVDGDRIASVGTDSQGLSPVDLGNATILPGLVNAHTHLEFSDLEEPLGIAGMAFPDWIREVVDRRRGQAIDLDAMFKRKTEAIRQGLHESLQNGVCTLGEIATGNWPADLYQTTPGDVTVFHELLGLSEERIEPLLQNATEHIGRRSPNSDWRAGLSPHSPYTVHPDLLRRAVQLSREQSVPLAMHLAESCEELELLASASGAMVEMLRELGAWYPNSIPRGLRPMHYLEILAGASRALIIHGNYLTTDEIQFLADRAETMSVVYCPRTRAFFHAGNYPLSQMLAAGVNVALGTDSRASNPDLSILSEMQFVADQHEDIALNRILEMGTINGAEALGLEHQCGSLTVGKQADLTIIELPNESARDPHELLLRHEAQVLKTMCAGQWSVV